MGAEWPQALLVLLIGPAVGSFLGVLVDRLPEGRSVLGRSRCAACQSPLPWHQMIPLLSAVWSKHRCAACGVQIPGHLIRIELAAIVVAAAAVLTAETTLHLWMLALSFWCLVALFYTDLLVMRLPDPLTGALLLCALGVAYAAPGRDVTEAALTGLGTAAALALLRWGYSALRRREGLGLGDVKLGAGFGALLGWELVPQGFLIAAGLALCAALIERLRGGSALRGDAALPFGTYMCGAALLLSIL